MKIIAFQSYKNFLNDYIKKSGRRGLVSELAKAAGCTHSYLSQVLNGKPDLTPDQAWAMAEHLPFNKDEAEYFFLLVLIERSVSQKLKINLQAKLKHLANQQLRTAKAVSPTTDLQLQALQRDYYYSNCHVGAIHTLTACSSFQKIDQLSDRLNIPAYEVEQILNWLNDHQLVKKKNDCFIHSGKSLHLNTESIHNRINHLNWRLRGIQSAHNPDEIHYTSTFSISKKDWDVLRSQLMEFIESQREKILSSGCDDGFAFCCDLFKV